MDILSRERPAQLEYQYLSVADQEKVIQKAESADDDLFPIQVEDACLVALTTAYNARDTEGGTTKQELFHFVEECFELPAAKLKQLKERAKVSDRPEFYLKCKILRASGLTPKDAYVLTGPHNPYCRLGILNGVHFDSLTVKQKDLEVWRKEGLIEGVVSTKVKQATLEPEWNEDFHLSVFEPSKELLVLEVWDGNQPTEKGKSGIIKGIIGIGSYIADKTIYMYSKSDDFIGRLFYPLHSIPNSGEEKTFALHSHSGKTQRGYITLQLSIKSKKKNPIEIHLLEYAALTHAVVNYNTRRDGTYVRKWNGELPPMAEKLLEHHAALNDVDSLQQTCIRFSALVKYHKLYTVDIKAICDLIRKLKEHHAEFSTIGNLHQWKKQVFMDLNELAEEIQGVLKNHLIALNISSKSGIAEIEEQVKSLCAVYSFWPFTKQLPPEKASLKMTLENCIKDAVCNWFCALDKRLLEDVDSDAEHLIAFASLSEHCLDQCGRIIKFLNPNFSEVGVDYFSVFFIALDKLLCREAESRLKKCGVSSKTSTFAIYRSFMGILKMMKYVNKSKCDGLSILNFHKWLFKDMVNDWIRAAIAKCKDLITKAIAIDTFIPVTNDTMFSSSALDTVGFLLQVGSFWKHLEWPVAFEAYNYAISVVKGVSGCVLFYVGEMVERLSADDMFDKKGQFRATDKICTILSNMQHIRQELSQFEKKLQLQSFCDWLEAEEKLGRSFTEMVESILASADEDISELMDGIIIEIVNKLSSDIQVFIYAVAANVGGINDEEAADPLLEYLHCNLQTFVSHLYPTVLKNILHHVWKVSIESVDKCLGKPLLKKGTDSAQLHQRLFITLRTMKDFYHCGGGGLDDKDLDCEEYKTLYAKLDILRLPTEKLILHFFSDLVQHQHEKVESGKAELGTLLISVGYLKQSSVIEVDVIQGKNLPGFRDTCKSGLSDPFVQLTLLPSWTFSESSGKCFKTTVQKRTLNPFFNETFKLPAKQQEMDIEGTVLLLSVFDSDVVGVYDFAGMCVVACKDIPQLLPSEASLTDPNTPQRKNLTLPLFRYTGAAQLSELHARAHLGDGKANNFFKASKKLLGHSSLSWYHLSSKTLTMKLADQKRYYF